MPNEERPKEQDRSLNSRPSTRDDGKRRESTDESVANEKSAPKPFSLSDTVKPPTKKKE